MLSYRQLNWLSLLLMVLAICVIPALPATADDGTDAKTENAEERALDKLLSRDRWRERGFGVSLRPPIGARLVHQTGDKALLRMELPDLKAAIVLSVKQSEQNLDIFRIERQSMNQIGTVQPSSRIERKRYNVKGRPGVLVYYNVPGKKKSDAPYILGHGFWQLDPKTFVLLRLDVKYDKATFDKVKETYEAVFSSLDLTSPAEIDRQRKELIKAGDIWLQTIKPRDLRAAMQPDQLFILKRDDKPVGFMRMSMEKQAKELKLKGMAINIQLRLETNGGKQVIDSSSKYFLADNRTDELWEIKLTLRPNRDRVGNRKGEVLTFVETGVRGVQRVPGRKDPIQVVTVTRETGGNAQADPSGGGQPHTKSDKPRVTRWAVPEKGYLSQVEKELIGYMLPRKTSHEIGFYCYLPTASEVTFRTERIVPKEDGSATIHTRVKPDQPEQITVYDSKGNMVKRTLPDGTVMTPISAEELKRVWKD